MRRAPLTLLFVLAATQSGADPGAPSFDCAKATRADETAICADPALGALDRSIDAAYRKARDRLRSDPAALKQLRQEQTSMLAGRLDAFAHPSGVGLANYLSRWRDALDRVAEPRVGFDGGWASLDTIIEVKSRPDGRASVRVRGSETVRGAWACTYDGLGEARGGRPVVAWDHEADDEDGADSWLLELSRTGSLLTIKEIPSPDAPAAPPYCGALGRLAGDYMPADTGALARAFERTDDER